MLGFRNNAHFWRRSCERDLVHVARAPKRIRIIGRKGSVIVAVMSKGRFRPHKSPRETDASAGPRRDSLTVLRMCIFRVETLMIMQKTLVYRAPPCPPLKICRSSMRERSAFGLRPQREETKKRPSQKVSISSDFLSIPHDLLSLT